MPIGVRGPRGGGSHRRARARARGERERAGGKESIGMMPPRDRCECASAAHGGGRGERRRRLARGESARGHREVTREGWRETACPHY